LPLELRVQRIHPVNPKVLLAQKNGAGPSLRVRVQSSANYMLGMTIYAVHTEGDIYTIHGRPPRFRGDRLYRETP
jgi:DNA/RNA endonuclease YhcR with UshA esterase domain